MITESGWVPVAQMWQQPLFNSPTMVDIVIHLYANREEVNEKFK
jgi:hypothetical protein